MHVERLTIENIRPMRRLELDLSRETNRAGWHVLLGATEPANQLLYVLWRWLSWVNQTPTPLARTGLAGSRPVVASAKSPLHSSSTNRISGETAAELAGDRSP